MPFLILFLFCFSGLSADPCHPSKNGRTKEQFFPCARFVWSPVFPDNEKGVSFLGEGGGNHVRLGVTFGAIPSPHHRYKFSGEYLMQKTQFHFHTGRGERWVEQGAIGGTYQYIGDCEGFFQGLQLNAVYSDSFNTHVKTSECHKNRQKHPRRISGGSYVRGDIGAILHPWTDSLLILSGGFSHMDYHHRIESKRNEGGPSIRVEFAQALSDNWAFSFEGEFQKPFNVIEGEFLYSRCCEVGHFTLGVFALHSWGKGTGLHSVTSAGVEFGWSFGIDGLQKCTECDPCALKPIPSCSEMQDLIAWVSAPAVYMPQVIAIGESCAGPSSREIPDHTVKPESPFKLHLAKYFEGRDLSFSINELPHGVHFDPKTAVLKGFNDGLERKCFLITVEGKTKCSTTERSFKLFFEDCNSSSSCCSRSHFQSRLPTQ